MSWNYRVFKQVVDGKPYWGIREVYYDDGKPTGYCSASLDDWETREDLEGTHEMMAAAFSEPELTKDDFDD